MARLIVLRLALRQKSCSPDTSSYCEARGRLPEELFQRLVWQTGSRLHNQCPEDWLWKGRPVKVVDGTTLTMPDTLENQKAYPQSTTQKFGLGFPIARLVVLLSLGSGAALDLAIGPYKGKETGESALLRSILDRSVSAGDVLVADRCYSSYYDVVALIRDRGADIVVRRHQRRVTDFRRGRRLGKNDHLIIWDKPKRRPEWMDEKIFENFPDQLILREVKVQIRGKGMRVKCIVIVTTLLDGEKFTKDDIAELYHARWRVELDLRSLKIAMQMEPMRCKRPEIVRKEIWAYLLAYNMIRAIMAQAAYHHDIEPRQISFKGTMQTINAFRGYHGTDLPDLPGWHDALLEAVAYHHIADRPNRIEPRAIKRRPKQHRLLTEPIDDARKRLCNSTYA